MSLIAFLAFSKLRIDSISSLNICLEEENGLYMTIRSTLILHLEEEIEPNKYSQEETPER